MIDYLHRADEGTNGVDVTGAKLHAVIHNGWEGVIGPELKR